MFNFLRKWICGRPRSFNPVSYRAPGTPEQNSARLAELLTQDFEPVRDRTDNQCMAFGRFMSVVLLLERKMVRLLVDFDGQIERHMFGRKLEVYKAFLNAVDWRRAALTEGDYRSIISPLKEIKRIRDTMSHDLSITSFRYSDLRQTVGYINARRPDLAASFSECEDEQVKCLGAVMVFGFVFSEQIAHLQLRVGT